MPKKATPKSQAKTPGDKGGSPYIRICTGCDGRGKFFAATCPVCRGTGVETYR